MLGLELSGPGIATWWRLATSPAPPPPGAGGTLDFGTAPAGGLLVLLTEDL